MSEYAEKVRSIAVPRRWGSKEVRPVQREDNGKPAGYHVEHWSDRVDAVATPEPVRYKLKREDGDG